MQEAVRSPKPQQDQAFPTPGALIREGVATLLLNSLFAGLVLATATAFGVMVPSNLASGLSATVHPGQPPTAHVVFMADAPDCRQGGCGPRWSPLSAPLAREGGRYLNLLPGPGSLTFECVAAPGYVPEQRVTIDQEARRLFARALKAGGYEACYGYLPGITGQLVSLVVGRTAAVSWQRPGLKVNGEGDRVQVEMATVLGGRVTFDLDARATEKLLGVVMEGLDD